MTITRASNGVLLAAVVGAAVACGRQPDPAATTPALGASVERPATAASAAPGPTTPRSALAVDAAAARRGPPEGANVLLITVDSLRADMPWTGYERPVAPRLTELAQRSVVYTRGYAISSYTSMSLGGLLAGRYPSELKRDGYFFGTYPKENVMFPKLLQAKGYKTLSAHAHGYFKTAGFDQGFDAWEIVGGLKWNNTTDENVTSPQLLALAEKQLGSPDLDSSRFFAWYHFMDPHDRYMPHEGISYGKGLRDKYDAEVTFTDGVIGKLLDFVASKPWGARTVIVVSSDHGEAFGDHGQFAHGFELWENLVRVPLVVFAPGAAARRIDTPRSHIDLAKTFLELFGVEAPAEMRGVSLVSELYGAAAAPRDVFLDLPPTSDNDRRRAVVSGDKKVISFGTTGYKRAFDVVADPGETKSVTGDAAKDVLERFKAIDKEVVELPPTKCKEGCLSGAYLRKDGGT